MIPQRLLKAIQALTPDQQKEYQTIYQSKDTIVDRSTHLRRMVLTLSRDLPEDEIRKAVAQAYNIPIELLPSFYAQAELFKITAQSKKIAEITAKFRQLLEHGNAKGDKMEELSDIGRFLQVLHDETVISAPETLLPFPDFELLQDGKRIGVEHTRLLDSEQKALVKTAKFYVQKAEALLKPHFDTLSKTVNLYLNYEAPVTATANFRRPAFSEEERTAIVKSITDYVRAVMEGTETAMPAFIRQLQISDNQDLRFDLVLAEDYFTSHDFLELLLERVARKEAKANRYRQASSVHPLWLLMVVDDVNSFSGFDLKTARLPKLSFSNFDQIYLFEKYGGTVYRLLST